MKYEKMFDLGQEFTGLSGLFYVSGSFGVIDGSMAKQTVKNGNQYVLETEDVLLCAEFEQCDNGAVIRRDSLKNKAAYPIRINALFSRFLMEGYDYDVYTQFSSWQHENTGGWQRLTTQVTVSSLGIRTCDGATPVMGLYNRQNHKTTTFHLISEGKWKMNVKRHPHYGKADITVVETGLDNSGLMLQVQPGETAEFPVIMFYRSDDRLSLGTEKMHQVFHERYPRKKLPVMFNTWLCNFDIIDYETLCRQADVAAEMGFEIFTVDAGWFGNGERWDQCIGDWVENKDGAFCGRMAEFSEYIRGKGMIFGLWIEPERALQTSTLAKEHPEYLMHGSFMNYARQDVREHLVKVICGLIDTYRLGAMKFDFNDSFSNDPDQSAFYRYYEGQKQVISELRRRYPNLYLSGCASGGYRTDLGQAKLFDSFWISDNQGPREGLDIYKNAIKAVPPCVIEKWNVQTFLPGVLSYSALQPQVMPVSCNNGTWSDIVSVTNQYVKGFLSGGPLGFSCDLTKFPEDYKNEMKNFISEYKRERDFFLSAGAKVLCDTESFTVIEYSDRKKQKIKLHIFSRIIYQTSLTVYPSVSEDCDYTVNGTKYSGSELAENGITLPLDAYTDNDCIFVEIERI